MPAEDQWLPYEARSDAAPAGADDGGDLPCLPRGSVSACLVVRDEASLIGRCLDSLSGVVDEIVVVHDGPCDDETLALASRAGCRVFEAERYGHCERHLPFAYAQARGDWLLTIDADEFLSQGLRRRLRALTAVDEVDGYELLWPLWDGRRYLTTSGPYKLALARRAAMRMVGIIHTKGSVHGIVRRVDLRLEHQPPYDNFSLQTVARKWAPRARLQAREYLADLGTAPRFNYPGTVRWTRRRERQTRWAALLGPPAALHTFFFVVRDSKGQLSLPRRLRFAFTQALYRAMVTASIVSERRRLRRGERGNTQAEGAAGLSGQSTDQRTPPSAARASSSRAGGNAVAGE